MRVRQAEVYRRPEVAVAVPHNSYGRDADDSTRDLAGGANRSESRHDETIIGRRCFVQIEEASCRVRQDLFLRIPVRATDQLDSYPARSAFTSSRTCDPHRRSRRHWPHTRRWCGLIRWRGEVDQIQSRPKYSFTSSAACHVAAAASVSAAGLVAPTPPDDQREIRVDFAGASTREVSRGIRQARHRPRQP